MNQDITKFMELLKTDEALQGKLKAEADNYNGEQTPEAMIAVISVLALVQLPAMQLE